MLLTSLTGYHVFSQPRTSPGNAVVPIGRTLMLRAMGPLDEKSLLCQMDPMQIARRAEYEHSRVVVLDIYPCEYVDSDGLRWLLALKSALAESNMPLHVVARPNSRIRRNIDLLHADLFVYDTVQDALHPAG